MDVDIKGVQKCGNLYDVWMKNYVENPVFISIENN